MSEPYTPFSSKLFNLLGLAERIFLGVTIVALFIRRFEMEIGSLLPVAIGGLAIVYFLMAYRPPQKVYGENEQPKLSFNDLLVGTIVPKVGWIGCSVAVIGILFSFQGLKGSQDMLLIGGGTLAIASIIVSYAVITGNKSLTYLLMRTLPLCLICFILLTKSGFFN